MWSCACLHPHPLLPKLLQVEEIAVSKYGSLAAVQEEKQRRIREKIEDRARKRAAEEAKEQRAQQAAERVQAAVMQHASKAATQTHTEEGMSCLRGRVWTLTPGWGRVVSSWVPGLLGVAICC